MQFVDQGTASMFDPPFCCECKHMRQTEDEYICQHPSFGKIGRVQPCCSVARDAVWFGDKACGPDGKLWERR